MGKVLTQAAWTLFAVWAGAIAGSAGAWPVVGVAVLLGAVGAASQSRWVQRRVPLLQTQKQKLANHYDSCLALRQELTRQYKAGELEPWEAWTDHVRSWDRAFWAYMEQTRDDWRPMKRAAGEVREKEYSNWVEILRQMLEVRLTLISKLLAE
jgi:hypothetical protein